MSITGRQRIRRPPNAPAHGPRLSRFALATICLVGVAALGLEIYLERLEASFPSGCAAISSGGNSTDYLGSRLQSVLDQASRDQGEAGIQATVIHPDGTAWGGASGLANRRRQCPLTIGSLLYVGSLTKMYTAALVMTLVDDDIVALDQPAAQWLPADRTDSGITIRQLLRHTSGLANYTENPRFLARYLLQPRHFWQPAELLPYVLDPALRFSPGSQHEYSNSNYVALGLISEAAAGQGYGELLPERLLSRLGLHDTYFLFPAVPNPPVAHGYDQDLLRLGRRDVTALRTSVVTGSYSAGGILATSEDVAWFTQALFTGQITSRASLSEMTAFLDTGDPDIPEQTGYGLGLRRLVVDGRELWGHTGTIPGYSAISLYSPQVGYVITVLTNLSLTDRITIVKNLQHALLAGPASQ